MADKLDARRVEAEAGAAAEACAAAALLEAEGVWFRVEPDRRAASFHGQIALAQLYYPADIRICVSRVQQSANMTTDLTKSARS